MLNSDLMGLKWPGIPDPTGATMVTLLNQFQETEWWSEEQLRTEQFNQLRLLIKHFENTSPFYRERQERLRHPVAGDITLENISEVPILTRTQVQEAAETLFSTDPPADHGEIVSYATSGSTGRPATFKFSLLNEAFHGALGIRNDIWHGRNFEKKFALIQCFKDQSYAPAPNGHIADSWAKPFETGPFIHLNCGTCMLSDQLDWLLREKPNYILSYPSNLEALARLSAETEIEMPWLEQVSVFSEALSPAQRKKIEHVWNVPIKETYGAVECSMIAFQCPEYDHLHVQSENVLVEIVDDDGAPCGLGQTGRVLVTDLHNFVTPIIRYEIGDLARFGDPCPTGRGLPVIDHVLGRVRNMMRLPDGDQAFPLRWTEDLGRLAPLRQLQIVQTSFTQIDVIMAVARPLSDVEESAILVAIADKLGHPFNLCPIYVKEIRRPESGKFEDFRVDDF